MLVTVSDKKLAVSANGTTIDYYNADVVTASDYYPGGMQMPGRKYSQPSSSYRYGYQSFEKDDEVKGSGNHLSFGDFGYDPRIVRRWTVDKHTFNYPSISPYASFNNNPIIYSDPDGKDAIVTIKGNVITVSTKIVLWGADATKDAVNKFQAELNGTWNANKLTYKDAKSGVEYVVKFDIQVELAGGKEKTSSIPWGAYNPSNTNNYVQVDNASACVRGTRKQKKH